MKKEREFSILSLLCSSPMFTNSCEHCVNTSRDERIAEAAARERGRGDKLALKERVDYAAERVRVDVQVSEKLPVTEGTVAAVVPQVADGLLPERVELVVVYVDRRDMIRSVNGFHAQAGRLSAVVGMTESPLWA